MCQRYLYDNLISFIGAWLLFIFTLSLWYWIACICNMHYVNKWSIGVRTLRDFLEPFHELTWSYWHKC